MNRAHDLAVLDWLTMDCVFEIKYLFARSN